jgi:hypothetical protein
MLHKPNSILLLLSILILSFSIFVYYKYPIEEQFYYFNNDNVCPICYNEEQLQAVCSSSPGLHRCCQNCRQNLIQSALNRNIAPKCPLCRSLVDSENIRDRTLQMLEDENEEEDDLDTLDEDPSLMLNDAIEEGNLQDIIDIQNQYNLTFTIWNLDDAIMTRRENIVDYILDQTEFRTHPNLIRLAVQNRLSNSIIQRLQSRL